MPTIVACFRTVLVVSIMFLGTTSVGAVPDQANPRFPMMWGYGSINPVPNPPVIGEPVEITVSVSNDGMNVASGVEVQLASNDWGITFSGWQPIRSMFADVGVGQTVPLVFTHSFPHRGHMCLEAKIIAVDAGGNTHTTDDRAQINMEVVYCRDDCTYQVPIRNNHDKAIRVGGVQVGCARVPSDIGEKGPAVGNCPFKVALDVPGMEEDGTVEIPAQSEVMATFRADLAGASTVNHVFIQAKDASGEVNHVLLQLLPTGVAEILNAPLLCCIGDVKLRVKLERMRLAVLEAFESGNAKKAIALLRRFIQEAIKVECDAELNEKACLERVMLALVDAAKIIAQIVGVQLEEVVGSGERRNQDKGPIFVLAPPDPEIANGDWLRQQGELESACLTYGKSFSTVPVQVDPAAFSDWPQLSLSTVSIDPASFSGWSQLEHSNTPACPFPPCDFVACTRDLHACPDGSFVGRDPSNHCEFRPCSVTCDNWNEPCSGNQVVCVRRPCDVPGFSCGEGMVCHDNYCGGCNAVCCPNVQDCPDDVHVCPGGTHVTRDPLNNCEFHKCPVACARDVQRCEDGSLVTRDPENGCAFFPCPFVATCGNWDEECPPWEPVVSCFVDPCRFVACGPHEVCHANYCGGCHAVCCTEKLCPKDLKTCPDGSTMERDPDNRCNFYPCPLTCDNYDAPCPPQLPLVSCLVAPCSLDPCGRGEACHDNYCGGCNHVCCPEQGCPKDLKTCPDGSTVERDPNSGCEFFPCPDYPTCSNYAPVATEPVYLCQEGVQAVFCAVNPCDVASCPAGTVCHFTFCGGCHHVCCPPEDTCPEDVKLCWDGSFVSRDPANSCAFLPCPGCPKDRKLCDDGTSLVRDPELGCEFPPCPGYLTCDNYDDKCPAGLPSVQCFLPPCDVVRCASGEVCHDNYCGGCNHVCCPEAGCPRDLRTCPDGSFVVRDPDNDCEFPPCPPVGCTRDLKECPDGTMVARDPELNCEFPPCLVHCDNWQELQAPCNGPQVVCPESGCAINPCGPGFDCHDNFCETCDRVCCPRECPPMTCSDGTVIQAHLSPVHGCIFLEQCPQLTCDNYDADCPGMEVACLVAPCSLDPCAPGEQCFDNFCGGCNHVCCPGGCPEDLKSCADGTVLHRDPANNCQFPACPSWLTCDNYDDKCPPEEPAVQCGVAPCDSAQCGAGEVCHDNYCGGCNHVCCPETGCPRDLRTCPDGSFVVRDPDNDCEFPQCTQPSCDTYKDPCPPGLPEVMCMVEPCSVIKCAVGQVCHNNYCGGCNAVCCFHSGCPEDLKQCPDGSYVGRDPANNCEFKPCGEVACPDDVKECPDGNVVIRDPANNCEFKPCPLS